MDAVEQLERGRDAYARRAWREAHDALSRAEEAAGLAPDDLWALATCAYMLGRDEEGLPRLERAYHAHLEHSRPAGAVRCAFWLGVQLAMRGASGEATGWFSRARRLYERGDPECAERGYVLLAAALGHAAAGEWPEVERQAAEAAAVGERFGEPDLLALGLQDQGRARIRLGRLRDGVRLLDEAMAGVTAGEVSPIVAGLLFCSAIDGCQEAQDLRRAAEWTTALTRWCERQVDLVPFTGQCLVHRAEVLQLRGAWPAALEESRRAAQRLGERASMGRLAAAQAHYRQGELHRLRGEDAAAEEAYRQASQGGCEPQPGLALLRLAQGRSEAAVAAIRRAVGEAADPVDRARLLPAHVEIMLAVGDLDAARAACGELEGLAAAQPSDLLAALAAHARGAVELGAGDAHAALPQLRRAWRLWEELEVPFEAARSRVLVALACRTLGDAEGGAMELAAARATFRELGAARDVERVDALRRPARPAAPGGLTPRELEVLRLVAGGETNRAIAAALVLSQRTVDRHVSNILAKLGLPSRSAATAYAHRHGLV